MLYARAFKKAFENGSTPDEISTDVLMKQMRDLRVSDSVKWASGKVQINKQMDRGFDSYELKYFKNGTFLDDCTETKYKNLNDKSLEICEKFKWRGGNIPVDVPECGFDGEKCEKMAMLQVDYLTSSTQTHIYS